MKFIIYAGLSLIFTSGVGAQTPQELISGVRSAQEKLNTVYYKVYRSDTFTTGSTRIITGRAKIKKLPQDTLLGFAYWGTRDSVNQETIYDGKAAFSIDHDEKSYAMTASPASIPHYYGSPGGQVIVPDLVKLDTTKVLRFELKANDTNYVLKMYLPDVPEEDVGNRFREITINKRTMLPVMVRSHLEALGKVQDLNYRIDLLVIDEPSLAYDFSAKRFPDNYTLAGRAVNTTLMNKKGKEFPRVSLVSFADSKITNKDFLNKVVLFDFWEVWCGPCLASMPRVDSLYSKYQSKGLEIFGIMSEKDQFEAAKLLVAKRKVSFPMIMGSEDLKKQLGINAVPTYILLSREGKISFISEGYSDEMEAEIVRQLGR